MPYSTASDVRILINTEKTDLELTTLIADSDYDLDNRLKGNTMDTTIKKLCSARLTAIVIAQNQRGVYSDKPENKSTTEWQTFVDEKVEDAKKGGKRTPKIVSSSHQHQHNYSCGYSCYG